MQGRQSSSGTPSSPPILTIQVGRYAAVTLLIMFLAIAGLIVFLLQENRQRAEVTTSIVQKPAEQAQALSDDKHAQPPSSAPVENREATSGARHAHPNVVVQSRESNRTQSQAIYTQAVTRITNPQPRIASPVVASALAVAISSPPSKSLSAAGYRPAVRGAGSTFLRPIYEEWFDLYERQNPGVHLRYDAHGSRAGVRSLISGEADFSTTDEPMNDEQLNQLSIKLVQIPCVLGAVVPIYNVPGVQGDIRFTADILAGIFLGKITFWDDPELVSANPDRRLPRLPIVVVHRSDKSAANAVFADFLSKASPLWANEAGSGLSIVWPTATAAEGNEGVASAVRQTEGSVGYIDYLYSQFNHIPFGSVQSRDGHFVKASPETMTAAATAVRFPSDFRVSLINAPGLNSYPITTLGWVLLPQSPSDHLRRASVLRFLAWSLIDGENSAADLHYGRLPEQVARQALEAVTALAQSTQH